MRKVLLSATLMAVAAAVSAGADKKPPKKPDRPFSIAVIASPRPPPKTEYDTTAAKEVSDSIADIQNNIRDKRQDWFTLVSDPEQAEVILELAGRGEELDHGSVLRGRVYVLSLEPTPIIGQGGLNSPSAKFRVWREAASDVGGRLQHFLQKIYDTLSGPRKVGVKPLAVMQNDRGVDLFRSDQVDASLAAFGEAIRLSPGLPSPHFNRGLVLSSRKDYEHATADFDETLRLEPSHPKAHLFRGIAYRERGMLEPARADLEEAVRIDPKDGAAHLGRGAVLQSLGEPRAAIADLDQAIALGASKGEALAARGSAYQALGEKDKALADLDAALAAGYRSAVLYHNRGRMLREKNDPRACESFAQAAVLDKTDADALFERGLCNVKQGQLDWAIADFSEVIRQKPDRAEAWWNRGLCYGKQKKTRLASADRAQALKLDPGLARKK